MEGEVARLWPQVATERDGAIELQQSALVTLHPAVQTQMLRKAYAIVMGNTLRLEERHLKAMAKLAQGEVTAQSLDLPGGLKFHRSLDQVRISRGAEPPCPFAEMEGEYRLAMPTEENPELVCHAGPWQVTLRLVEHSKIPVGRLTVSKTEIVEDSSEGESWTAYFDRRALGNWMQVRSRQTGDRFQPLGMNGTKKLQDFFTDEKVPKARRDRVPLLETQRGIAWVVGYRIAHWARVEPGRAGTERVIVVTLDNEK